MTRAKRQLLVVCDSKSLNSTSVVSKRAAKNSKKKKNYNPQNNIDTDFLKDWIRYLEKESTVQFSKVVIDGAKTDSILNITQEMPLQLKKVAKLVV